MSLGLIGRKCGMTRIFTKDGESIPVTIIHVSPNTVTQIKTTKIDGYNAIQVTRGIKKRSRVIKPEAGHFSKANVEPGEGLWEFRVSQNVINATKIGSVNDLSIFKVNQKVDITGFSKGKGFQGVIKRHNFSGQDATHGNSLSHRVHGSIGQNQTPGRVFKNKKMAGHMGNEKITVQCLEIIKIDIDHQILALKGSVPGSVKGNIIIKPSIKHKSIEL